MKSKIRLLTVVCQEGTKSYEIGCVYNDLLLDRIEDKSMEYPDSLTSIYRGSTVTGGIVFEVINAPIEVEYMKVSGG